ncbi:bifunctional 3-demethylubiquinone-9 3-methyltransferase/ 2-octaprenyl-6-hydroxy phenol methylase [Posidoniimonas corsicana]|uniref:Bifunctional 3-demethylubiquinone-9 3-methyltransferase/ 2-octaprenyl-6-hydroxy phenol methylase n=1 Tax=Posidoniimonas corsicana TaxID=1938618 RepID=A0A5C5VCZ5_9BACT|nr:class I SAM-dependent methyltransferase [Posidoniimonas corsicana]TWT36091.1 bifunctional 3-demethylubiquinone-9 3-methyltransferase/ 2-octaprenyl-6-hydroxy phenol methylase [Posidoniimonas corsicana]
MTDRENDQHMIRSWLANAQAWADAVRHDKIESRVAATNHAIVSTVTDLAPASVLDVGCGEGWLARSLAVHGVDVLGVDAVPGLVQQANEAGGARFSVCSYEEIAAGALTEKFDAVVFNFSLFGDELVSRLFATVPSLLNPGGCCVVQTVHPLAVGGELPYQDGWRTGFRDGLGDAFQDPPPWYFRTLASWVALFSDNRLRVVRLREPMAPGASVPSSLVLVGQAG